jgi:hypothetical protein
VAPGFAASGSDEDNDSRDQAATDAEGAALRYLRYGSNEDMERAEAALCEDASPELTPSDLDDIRQSYDEALGGIERVDLETGDPVPSTEGIDIAGTVSYIYRGNQRHEEFLVTVQEKDGTYCVSNAVQAQEEEEPSSEGATGETIDPQALAADFLRSVVVDRDPQAATSLQCSAYTGITAQDLDAAIADWAATNGSTTGYLNSLEPADATGNAVTMFETEVRLDGELNIETFVFQIGVQGDCIASIEGGDDLMNASED